MKLVNGLTIFYDGVFSNFYPCHFVVDGITYNCSEQYFMYQKACTFKDQAVAQLILKTTNPYNQKKFGRAVGDYDDKLWKQVRYHHMYDACWAKFSQNNDLKCQLLATQGTRLVEASPNDTIWGIGLSEDSEHASVPNKWLGTNLLGQVLDEVRENLLMSGVNND